MDTPSATALQTQLFINTALSLSAPVILLYDHIITFDNEYYRIWTKPWCKASAIFLVTRYVAFLMYTFGKSHTVYNLAALLRQFTQICQHFTLYRQIAIGIMQLIVAANQFLRVYALYGLDRRVAAAVVFTAASVGAVCIWAVTMQKASRGAPAECHLMISNETADRLGIVWVAFLIFDLLVFGLILTKAAKDRAQLAQAKQGSIITIIYRDSAMYFAVMSCAHCVNVITFFALPPALKGAPSALASSISVTLMSRWILNLHEHDVQLLGVTREGFEMTLLSCPAPVLTTASDYINA